jgi:hypothetical protein
MPACAAWLDRPTFPDAAPGASARHSPRWRRFRLSTGVLCLLLLCVQLLPPLPVYVGLASSMAAGVMLAAAVCIVTVAACWAIQMRAYRQGVLDIGAGGVVLIATVLVLVTLHGIVADQIMGGIAAVRFVASLGPLVLLLGAAVALNVAIRGAEPSQIVAASWVSFWVLCGVILLKLTGLQPRAGAFGKSTFPFTETSHFALAFGPVFLYRCASASRSRRSLWVLMGFGLAVALRSGTLLVIAVIAAMISHRILVVVLFGLLVALVGLSVELKYFTSRADLSDKSSNLTALVYLEGWQMLDSSLAQSDGWGLGFQQLGVHSSHVTAAEAIERITGGQDLNRMDGSFVLSKLGSEFGAIGLILSIGYCAIGLRSLRRLRAGHDPPALRFAHSIVVAYGVDMFVRGIGYFSPSSLLFMGALLVLMPAGGLIRMGHGARLQSLMVLR